MREAQAFPNREYHLTRGANAAIRLTGSRIQASALGCFGTAYVCLCDVIRVRKHLLELRKAALCGENILPLVLATRELVGHVHSFFHLAESGESLRIQPGVIGVIDKKVRRAAVRLSGLAVCNPSTDVAFDHWFVLDCFFFPGFVQSGIGCNAGLSDKTVNYPEPRRAVIESGVHKFLEMLHALRRPFRMKLYNYIAFRRFEYDQVTVLLGGFGCVCRRFICVRASAGFARSLVRGSFGRITLHVGQTKRLLGARRNLV